MKTCKFLLLPFFLVVLLLSSCSNHLSSKNNVSLSFHIQNFYNIAASRNASQDVISYELGVELYVNGSLFESSTQTLDKEKTTYTFNFSNITVGSTVFARAEIVAVAIKDGKSVSEQLAYGESDKIKIESASTVIPLKLKWVELQPDAPGTRDEPIIIEITVSALKTAIQNYIPGVYTIYKVQGQMTDDDYDEVIDLVTMHLRNGWNKYIGLDLSEVEGLTKVKWIANLTSLTIPNTVTKLSFDRLFGLKVLPDHPAFTMEDGVLYSKDKTVLYYYPMGKTGTSFEIPSGVKNIRNFAFEEADLEEIIIPESVIDIGMRAFYGQTLIFKDKENWISDITGKVLTTQELEDPQSFTYFNMETYESGPCRNGIYKPVTKNVSVENIVEEINSFNSEAHTIFIVSGEASNDQYSQICSIIQKKGIDEGWTNDQKGYIGLDLTGVSGLTRLGNVGDYIFTLAIPDTVSEISYLSSYTVAKLSNLSNHPYFEFVDEVLYSKDKTILYAYPRKKEDISFTIPDGVTKINNGAFYGTTYLQNLTIPESVVYIGFNAFGYSKIQTLSFVNPDGWVTRYYNNPLTQAQIENPSNYTNGALCAEGILKSYTETINIAAGDLLQTIRSYQYVLGRFTTYVVTGSMTNDDYKTIENLLNNKRSEWNNTLYISLDLSAVSGLTKITDTWGLRSLVIPDTVGAFDEYTDLSNVIVSDTNECLEYDNGVLYSKDKKILYFYPENKTDATFEIPSTVNKIWANSFRYNTSIENISIPQDVNFIGSDAFRNENIKTLTFANKDNWKAKHYYYDRVINVSAADLEVVQNYQVDRSTGVGGLLQNSLLFKPQSETVTASELITKLNSYEAGTFTVYKVTGAMTYDEYEQAFSFLWEKLNYGIWTEKYIGLDLSEAEGLTKIGHTWCFSTVIIPGSVETIADYSSGNIVGLESNSHFKYVDDVLYTSDGSILCYYPEDKTETTFTIPSTVTKIWSYAFIYNTFLENLAITENVVSIGGNAFNDTLYDLTFADKNNWYSNDDDQLISESDLENPLSYGWNEQTQTSGVCSSGIYKVQTKTVTFSELAEEINSYQAGTYTIYKVTGTMSNDDYTQIHELIGTKINNGAGDPDYVGLDLTQVSGLTSISSTWALLKLIIPDTVTTIEDFAVMRRIVISENNTNFTYEDGVLYSADKKYLYFYPEDKTDETFQIPSGVEKIWRFCFYYNKYIKNVSVPESAVSIGDYAFATSNITSVSFGTNTDGWLTQSGESVSSADLANVANFMYNYETHESGLCLEGIHK